MSDKKRVVVAMSGGVDSSVAAYLLKEQGYDVIGVTMQIWQDEHPTDNGGCCGLSAVDDARRVCDSIGIRHYVLNFKDIFRSSVIDYFIDEYKNGKTPNPCIACNSFVKWKALLKRAEELEADFMATGHYARIHKLENNGRLCLQLSKTNLKDQTYALYSLTQYELSKTIFPIGDYTKDEVRSIARGINLVSHDKPDSQEICFIPDNDYGAFLKLELGNVPATRQGNFVDAEGNILGKHKGIVNYTIGQRKGLGIAFGEPRYVKAIDAHKNEVVLDSNEALYKDVLYARNLNFMMTDSLVGEVEVYAKIRYSHRASAAKIRMQGDALVCEFNEPQRAITPGQAVVFYVDDFVFGGGVIL